MVGDIWACFKGKDIGEFEDIDKITMFADYRVPQVLLHFGAMRYSNPLLNTLQCGELFFLRVAEMFSLIYFSFIIFNCLSMMIATDLGKS